MRSKGHKKEYREDEIKNKLKMSVSFLISLEFFLYAVNPCLVASRIGIVFLSSYFLRMEAETGKKRKWKVPYIRITRRYAKEFILLWRMLFLFLKNML